MNHVKNILAAVFLAEGMVDTGCTKLNKLQSIAMDLGSSDFDFSEGVGHVQITGPEAAQQFMDALDAESCVEGYDVTHSGDEGVEDILTLPEDTSFAFTFYLDEDTVKYDPEEVESVSESTGAFYVLGATNKGPYADAGLAAAAKTLDEQVAFGRLAADGAFEQLGEAVAMDEHGMVLSEAVKKIQVNFKGAKRIKMQCPGGFKYSATDNACVKIAGDELAKRRKASVRAVVSRKAGGAALKTRAAIRTKKAMNFRKAMGLK